MLPNRHCGKASFPHDQLKRLQMPLSFVDSFFNGTPTIDRFMSCIQSRREQILKFLHNLFTRAMFNSLTDIFALETMATIRFVK